MLRLLIEVWLEEKSYSRDPLPTLMPPANVEVAVALSALKYCAAAAPATESCAYGDEVPRPR